MIEKNSLLLSVHPTVYSFIHPTVRPLIHPTCIVGNDDCYFAYFGRKVESRKQPISNKQRSNLLANLKKEALTNLEKKERNEKRRKIIAEVSDFGDKLIRLNMIVSHKPNLSVAVGQSILLGLQIHPTVYSFIHPTVRPLIHPTCIVGNDDCYFAYFGRKVESRKQPISNKQRSNLLANLKKEALTNLEKKERNEKRRKIIAEVSDFGDKLIRLNMIVSHKPNLSVAVGQSILLGLQIHDGI